MQIDGQCGVHRIGHVHETGLGSIARIDLTMEQNVRLHVDHHVVGLTVHGHCGNRTKVRRVNE